MIANCFETLKVFAMAAKVMLRCRSFATLWAIFE